MPYTVCTVTPYSSISLQVEVNVNGWPRSKASDLFGYTKENHRAWYLKSCDQLTSLSGSKDGCVSLRFARDFV